MISTAIPDLLDHLVGADNVALLGLLGAAAEKQDNLVAALTEVDTVTLAFMNTQLTEPSAYGLNIAEVAELQSLEPDSHLLLCTWVSQPRQPSSELICLPDHEHDAM